MKRIIADCFTLGERLYNGEPIIKAESENQGIIELENGTTIKDTGDGRLYDIKNDLYRYAAVYDWDDENDYGNLIGYVEL